MRPKIFCPHCNAELRLGDKFCGNCGKPIEWSQEQTSSPAEPEDRSVVNAAGPLTCKTCGTVNKPGIDFCKRCGSDLRTPSSSVRPQASAAAKQGKKEGRGSKPEIKSSSALGRWTPIAAVVVIVAAAIAIEMYVSKQNIPTDGIQQPKEQPQQPTGANMAALSQIQDMEQQVKASPGNSELVLNLANFLSDNRFYDKAITYYKTYLDKKPKDANARVDLGICYKEVGSFDNAMQEMKKALEVDPRHLFATFNLGIVTLDEGKMYMDQGQMDKANVLITESNDWFRKTVALAPTSEVGKRAQQLLTQHSNTQLPQSK